MPKKPGEYHRPEDLSQALRYLSEPNTVLLGGGTKLLATEEGLSYAAVIDLQALGLNQVRRRGDELKIGSSVTLTELDHYLTKNEKQSPITSLLSKAIRQAGPNTYRNAATLGGTIASRLENSELLAALLVLEADVMLHNPDVEKISLRNYLQNEELPRGLISEISLSWGEGQGISERVARTPADYPIVSITCWQPVDRSPRMAATGLGLRPARLPEVEAVLQGGVSEKSIDEAAQAAARANRHGGDFRGHSAYRAEMALVLTRRVLNQLISD